MNFIPIVGALLTTCVVAAGGIAEHGASAAVLVPAATFLLLHVLESQFVTPLLLGRTPAAESADRDRRRVRRRRGVGQSAAPSWQCPSSPREDRLRCPSAVPALGPGAGSRRADGLRARPRAARAPAPRRARPGGGIEILSKRKGARYDGLAPIGGVGSAASLIRGDRSSGRQWSRYCAIRVAGLWGASAPGCRSEPTNRGCRIPPTTIEVQRVLPTVSRYRQ